MQPDLVGEVDGGVEHAQAVLADGGGDALDADGVQMLRVAVRSELHKLLHIYVVLSKK